MEQADIYNPTVSIVMPSYNSELFVAKSIESIKNQTYTDWELLITDDCSSDNTVEIIQTFVKKDERIKLFCSQKNSGPGMSRNNCIREARGRYIAFCDSDDLWLPQKLEIQLKFLNDNQLGFTYCSYFIQNEKQNIRGCIYAPIKISYQEILRQNYIGCLTAIYDSKQLGKVYMPNIRKRQDYVLWIKIIEKLKIVKGIQEPMAIYTIRKDSISSKKLKLIKYNWLIYYKVLNFSVTKSIFYMIQFLYFYAKKKVTYKKLTEIIIKNFGKNSDKTKLKPKL